MNIVPSTLTRLLIFITAPCTLIVLKYAKINPRGIQVFLYIRYPEAQQFFSVSFFPERRINNYKPKTNRAVIVISWISDDEMANNLSIVIYCSEREKPPFCKLRCIIFIYVFV